MTKIFVISDDGVSSGFGRISAMINRSLVKRGYELFAASLAYDGKLPPQYDGQPLPYWVRGLQPYTAIPGYNLWGDIAEMVNVIKPDVIWVTQDAPYGVAARSMPLDWSQYAFVITTPVDGSPIFPEWVEMVKNADAALTISEFGVKAFAAQGVSVNLCRPGIDPDRFFRLPDDKRAAIRARLNIAPDAYVHGMMSMNQGRKAIPETVRGFMDFAKDKPDARLVLDMDEISPAGWHLPAMCQQYGWDEKKLIYRSTAASAGVTDLNERYNLLDSHSVLSYREGFGLPVLESMATGAVSMAQDWCAGTEVLEDGRGILVPPVQLDGEDYFHPSTWGNALDKMPDYRVFTQKLQWLHDNPDERRAMGKRGMDYARQQTWTKAVDNAEQAVQKALAKKHKPAPIAALLPPIQQVTAAQVSPDGLVDMREKV